MKTASDWRKHPFARELWKRDRVTYSCLCRLQKCGCDPLSIILTLSLLEQKALHLLSNHQQDFAGMNAEDLRQFASQIERMAGKIRKFNRARAAWTVLRALPPQSPLLNLPAQMNQYAVMLQGLSRLAGPKKHLAVSCQRGILVRDVRNASGRYHDEEVSRLIAYAEKNDSYSRRAHIRWRGDNSQFIQSLPP